MRQDLEAALAALDRNDPPAALDALVRAWSYTRDDRIAALIRTVSADVTPPAIGAGGTLAAHREWLALAAEKRPRDLAALLPEMAGSNTTRGTERLGALAHRSDPRIGDAVIALLASPRHRGDRPPYIRAQIDLLIANADVRVRDALAELAPKYASVLHTSVGERMQPQLLRALATIDAARTTLAPLGDLEPWVEKLEARFARELRSTAHTRETATRTARTEAELLADVYAHPDDDAPRAVYADWLLERGDERGEFIQLQLADARGALGGEARTRMHELEKRHGSRWQGELVSAWAAVRYRRGFPHSLWSKHDAKSLASTARPEWRTIREITGGFSGANWAPKDVKAFVKLLSAPNLSGVRHLARMCVEGLPQIPPLPLRSVALQFFPATHWTTLASALPRFSTLEELSFPVDAEHPFPELLDTLEPALGGLHELSLGEDLLRTSSASLRRLLGTRLARVRLTQASDLVLEREGSTFRAELDIRMGLHLGESTMEAVVAWVEANADAPIGSLTLVRPQFFDDAQKERLRRVLDDRLRA